MSSDSVSAFTSSDFLVRGLGLDGRARIVAATTARTVEELRRIHDPSPTTATAVGRLATGALLLAAAPAELVCEFCRRRYEVSREELEALLVELELEKTSFPREA